MLLASIIGAGTVRENNTKNKRVVTKAEPFFYSHLCHRNRLCFGLYLVLVILFIVESSFDDYFINNDTIATMMRIIISKSTSAKTSASSASSCHRRNIILQQPFYKEYSFLPVAVAWSTKSTTTTTRKLQTNEICNYSTFLQKTSVPTPPGFDAVAVPVMNAAYTGTFIPSKASPLPSLPSPPIGYGWRTSYGKANQRNRKSISRKTTRTMPGSENAYASGYRMSALAASWNSYNNYDENKGGQKDDTKQTKHYNYNDRPQSYRRNNNNNFNSSSSRGGGYTRNAKGNIYNEVDDDGSSFFSAARRERPSVRQIMFDDYGGDDDDVDVMSMAAKYNPFDDDDDDNNNNTNDGGSTGHENVMTQNINQRMNTSNGKESEAANAMPSSTFQTTATRPHLDVNNQNGSYNVKSNNDPYVYQKIRNNNDNDTDDDDDDTEGDEDIVLRLTEPQVILKRNSFFYYKYHDNLNFNKRKFPIISSSSSSSSSSQEQERQQQGQQEQRYDEVVTTRMTKKLSTVSSSSSTTAATTAFESSNDNVKKKDEINNTIEKNKKVFESDRYSNNYFEDDDYYNNDKEIDYKNKNNDKVKEGSPICPLSVIMNINAQQQQESSTLDDYDMFNSFESPPWLEEAPLSPPPPPPPMTSSTPPASTFMSSTTLSNGRQTITTKQISSTDSNSRRSISTSSGSNNNNDIFAMNGGNDSGSGSGNGDDNKDNDDDYDIDIYNQHNVQEQDEDEEVSIDEQQEQLEALLAAQQEELQTQNDGLSFVDDGSDFDVDSINTNNNNNDKNADFSSSSSSSVPSIPDSTKPMPSMFVEADSSSPPSSSPSSASSSNKPLPSDFIVNPLDDEIMSLQNQMDKLEKEIFEMNSNQPFNLRSHKQVSKVIFGESHHSTAKDILEGMAVSNIMAKLILQHRQVAQQHTRLMKKKQRRENDNDRRKKERQREQQQRQQMFNKGNNDDDEDEKIHISQTKNDHIQHDIEEVPKVQKQRETLILVDTSSYIFRAYYSMPPIHRNSDGMPIGTVMGFCNMMNRLVMNKLMQGQQPRVILCCDSSGPTFRHEMYPEYKAHRKEVPMDLIPQFPLILQDAAEAYGLLTVKAPGYEADDVIATLSHHAANVEHALSVQIYSGDKDLMQLITNSTTVQNDNDGIFIEMVDPVTGEPWDHDTVVTKWDVPAHQLGDVLALAGDTADNVPGVPGIGKKIAAQLINEYGTLENLLNNVDTIKQKKRKEKLIDYQEQARLSQRLVSLERDIPWNDMEWNRPTFTSESQAVSSSESSLSSDSLFSSSFVDEWKMEPLDVERMIQFFDDMGFQTMKNRFLNQLKQQELIDTNRNLAREERENNIAKKTDTKKRRPFSTHTKKKRAVIPTPKDYEDVPF